MRPTRDQILQQIAKVVAERGTCERAKVGAVVAMNGRILVTGYNGSPAGMKHCDHADQRETLMSDKGEIGTIYTGAGCKTAVHAEANAIAWAARHGIALQDAELFTTMSPCLPCAQLIINAGIQRVVYNQAYRLTDGLDLLQDAGVELE